MITEAQFKQYIDSISGPDVIKRDFEQSEADSRLLREKHEELLALYPDMYVACYKGQVVAAGSIEGLGQALDEKGIPSQFAARAFLATKPEVWVLQA